jgi:hypothetical protein
MTSQKSRSKSGVLIPCQIFNAYCDPTLSVSFPSPTAVSVYITDIPEFDYLAPCAKSAIRYGVQ